MGMTSGWSADTYDRVSSRNIRDGSTLYTDSVRASGEVKASPLLDILDEDGNPRIREARDSEAHHHSTPILIAFDETGSMDENPSLIQRDSKGLFGLLQRKGYVEDPQIAIGAYGDAWCDRVPIQVGQFESGNEVDEELDNVFIEGMGGGNGGESSALIPYYAAKYIKTDSWEKRRHKGYIFLIGDECSHDLGADELKRFVGEKEAVDVTAEQAFRMAGKQWDIYVLLIDNYQAKAQESRRKYAALVGDDHVIPMESGRGTAATIAAIIGAKEGTVRTGRQLESDLVAEHFDKSTAVAVRDATKGLYRMSDHGSQVDVKAEDPGDLDLS